MLDKKFFYSYKKRLKKNLPTFFRTLFIYFNFVIGIIKYYYIEWIIKN